METKNQKLQMRDYNAGDVFTVVDILTSVTKDVDSLRHIIKVCSDTVKAKGENKDAALEEAGQEIILYLLNNCYTHAKDKLIDWFADLYGMYREEYLAQAPDFVFTTIETIVSRGESRDFFTSAWRAFNRIKGLSITSKSG